MSGQVSLGSVAIIRQMSGQMLRGSAGEYQADERAGDDQIVRLFEAVHLPTEVSVSHCKAHQKGSMEVA